MKIAVVGPTYPYRGGIAHYSTLLVQHLRAAGHHTRFYSFVRQYPRWLFPGKTDRDPSSAPLRVECEYVLDPINPWTWWQLCRKLRADNPEVVLLQWWVPYWTPSLAMISRWIKRNTRSQILFVCHNVIPHEGGGFLDKRLALTVLRYGDAFIVHSEQDRYLLRALLPNARVYKSHHPTYAPLADQSHTTPSTTLREELGLPTDQPLLLFFGFVRAYKGLEYLIQALPRIRTQFPAHLLVVGEFWLSPEFFARYATEFGVRDAVTFINRYVPNEELRDYFDLADVVVLPYVSATQSGVAQLAFGFGKPVITTRVGGLHEIIEDGVTGLIVPPQDGPALADAVIRFFKADLGSQLRANVAARQQAQLFSWADLIATVEQIQRDLHELRGLPIGAKQ